MAAYRVAMARAMVPYRYLEADGSLADHNTPENAVAVNERGAPKEAFQVVGEGDILYTDAASYDKLTDEQKDTSDHEVFYIVNESYLGNHERLGTFEKLFDTPASK